MRVLSNFTRLTKVTEAITVYDKKSLIVNVLNLSNVYIRRLIYSYIYIYW